MAAVFAGAVAVAACLTFAAVHFSVATGNALSTHVIEPAAGAVFRMMDEMSYHPAAAPRANVSITDVWSRATPNAGSGVLYLTMTVADAPDRLTGVQTPRAASAQLHESVMQGAVSSMRPVEAIPVMPGKPVMLRPGGYHVMLLNLRQPLTVGETFDVTLTFENAGNLTVRASVAPAGAASMPGMAGTDHGTM